MLSNGNGNGKESMEHVQLCIVYCTANTHFAILCWFSIYVIYYSGHKRQHRREYYFACFCSDKGGGWSCWWYWKERGGGILSQNNSGASLIQFFGLFDTLHSLQLVYLTLLTLIASTLALLISMWRIFGSIKEQHCKVAQSAGVRENLVANFVLLSFHL